MKKRFSISPCIGGNCPFKSECWRFVMPDKHQNQSLYLDAPFYATDTGHECNEFIELPEYAA